MAISFRAEHVQVSRETWGHLVVLSVDKTREAEQYLMLQGREHYSERQVQWGQNCPYIECCGQGYSWYGHIVSFLLAPSQVEVQLDAEAASHMQNDGRVEVSFSLSPVAFEQLRAALQKIFRGCSYYAERGA